MSPENQALVRDSFAKIVPIAPQAAALFYDRLFALDPPCAAWMFPYTFMDEPLSEIAGVAVELLTRPPAFGLATSPTVMLGAAIVIVPSATRSPLTAPVTFTLHAA